MGGLKEKGGKKWNYKQVEHLILSQDKKRPGFGEGGLGIHYLRKLWDGYYPKC